MENRVANLSQRVSDLSRTDPHSASKAEQVLANVYQLPGRARQSPEINDPQRYLTIFRYLLMTSIFPLWGRPADPDNAGVTTRQDAWEWFRIRVREKLIVRIGSKRTPLLTFAAPL